MFFQKKTVEAPQHNVLVEALEEKYRLAEEARAGLEARLTNLLGFIRIMAHDLNGPVGNMAQLVEIIPQLPPGEEQEEYISLLSPTLLSMQTALDELRMVIDAQSKGKIPCDDCDIEHLLQGVRNRLNLATAERNSVITTSLQEKVVHYPVAYLEAILYGLIEYCLTHAKPGIAPIVRVTTNRDANRVVLTVETNSCNINVETEGSQLFTYRKSSHATHAGAGIGLFLIKNQIETLGGQIMVADRPGDGIVFTVLL